MTGSDSAGTVMGYYDTTALPIYEYLHGHGAPKYVIADQFFQGAFGGSYLNHQYLVCACAPEYPNADTAAIESSVILKSQNGVMSSVVPSSKIGRGR